MLGIAQGAVSSQASSSSEEIILVLLTYGLPADGVTGLETGHLLVLDELEFSSYRNRSIGCTPAEGN